MTQAKVKKPKNNNKELLCIFLGLEFYASPEKAKLLKSKVTDILLNNLEEEDLLSIDVKPVVDITPSYSRFKEKLAKLLK